jgi:hypothetical protein
MNSDPHVPWWLGLYPVRRPHPDESTHREALELVRLFAELGPDNRRKLIDKVESWRGLRAITKAERRLALHETVSEMPVAA